MLQKITNLFKKPITAEIVPPDEPAAAETAVVVPEPVSEFSDKPKKKEPRTARSQKRQMELTMAKGAKINALLAQMAQTMSPVELRELALDLSVTFENLPMSSSGMAYANFVAYLERRARIPDLLAALAERWPDVEWHSAEILQVIDDLGRYRAQESPPGSTQRSTTDWRKLLLQHFNLSELADLAFQLAIDFEALAGNDKTTKVNSLLAQVEKQQQWDQLAAFVAEMRDGLVIGEGGKGAAVSSPPSQKPFDQASMEQRQHYSSLLNSLSLRELQDICRQLGIDCDDLQGGTKVAQARELLVYLTRQNRLSALDPLLEELAAERADRAAYDTQRIRTLIFELFPDDVAMTDFCRQHLPEAVYEFGSGMSYRQKVQALLEYCALKKQFAPLLAALAVAYPAEYTAVGPYVQESH
jgi:hypothetical protein